MSSAAPSEHGCVQLSTVKGYTDPAEALGMCLITAAQYSDKHRWGLVQVTGLTYPGREHWASAQFRRDDLDHVTVVDLTMRQFDVDRPARWEGTLDDWLDDMSECLNDHLFYALYPDTQTSKDPVFADTWVREDIEPGSMLTPWRSPQPRNANS